MSKSVTALRMPRRPKRSRAHPPAREPPGGAGAMAALRRAQEKLRAMGIKLYKAPDPPAAAKGARTGAGPAKAPPAGVAAKPARRSASGRAGSAARKAPAAGKAAGQARAKATSAPKKAPGKADPKAPRSARGARR